MSVVELDQEGQIELVRKPDKRREISDVGQLFDVAHQMSYIGRMARAGTAAMKVRNVGVQASACLQGSDLKAERQQT
jgi:hypothetical protein